MHNNRRLQTGVEGALHCPIRYSISIPSLRKLLPIVYLLLTFFVRFQFSISVERGELLN